MKEEFQKSVFLSFLSSKKQKKILDFYVKLNIDKEKEALEDIYDHFSISKTKYMSRVKTHFEEAEEAIKRVQSGSGVSFESLLTIYDITRIHSISEEWSVQYKKISEIYKQSELFFKTINSMLHYKKLFFDSNNNIVAITNSEKRLSLSMLSSGEKQLFILLCEALLQKEEPWLYVADEPELSLHVAWQEKLIDCIRDINPNAQIFFATHSPDIVGSYSDHVFDLEEVLDGIH